MKLLVVSNFYPPARAGGYTQLCIEVAEALKKRGHEITVLTSNHRIETVTRPDPAVRRVLHLEGDLNYYRPLEFFLRWRANRRANERWVREVVRETAPDLVFVWGMWALSRV